MSEGQPRPSKIPKLPPSLLPSCQTMLPRTTILPRQRPRPRPGPRPGPGPALEPSSSSHSLFLAFLILLAALFSICLFAAAARRLFSLLAASSRRPVALPPPRRARATFSGAARGMDPAAVGSLPVLAYVGPSVSEGTGAPTEECCAVCLGELEPKERVKVIPRCGHVFHPPCIDSWLVERGSCPLCRCSASDMMVPGSGLKRCAVCEGAVGTEEGTRE